MTEAPDGTPMEVRRNFGKPNTAAQLLQKLRADKQPGKKAKTAAKAVQQDADDSIELKPAPAAHADDLHAIAEQIRKENAVTQTPPTPAAAAQPQIAPIQQKPTRKAKAATSRPTPAAAQPPVSAQSGESAAARSKEAAEPASAQGPETKTIPPKPPVDTRGMQPKHVVEAALFSAGKPIAIEEIAQETKLSPETIKKAIKDLAKDYDDRDTVLEVGKAGTKWAMQVRSRAAEPAARFAPMEIAPKLLKTLALIAYHQPMKQSELVDMIGTKVYDHIPDLVERGLVRAREEGVTKILVTTTAFPEYFGLDAEDPEGVRAAMAKLVGLPPPPPKAKQAEMQFVETQGAPASETATTT